MIRLIGYFTVLGALVGYLLLGPCERWIMGRGYLARSILPLGEADIASALWRKSWWWIMLILVARSQLSYGD